jgi:hypothetical protein
MLSYSAPTHATKWPLHVQWPVRQDKVSKQAKRKFVIYLSSR